MGLHCAKQLPTIERTFQFERISDLKQTGGLLLSQDGGGGAPDI